MTPAGILAEKPDTASQRVASVSCADVKIAHLETFFCDAGWRPWIFLKATTDDGLVGWAEITDSHGSPRGLAGIVEDLSPLVVGRDPRPVEAIYWDLYRATRQSPGSVIAKALAGIENALLDIKAKALGRPGLRAVRRTDTASDPDVLVALRNDARARVRGDGDTPKLATLRRRRRARPRGRRARLRRVQDERRRSRRRPEGAHAGVQRRRRDAPRRGDRRRARSAARGLPRGNRGRGTADRRPELQPRARGLRPRRQGAGAVRPALARGRPLRPGRARARPSRRTDAHLLRREPLREPRLPSVPRRRRHGRRLGRRHLERLPPGEEDRRPRGDVRGELRAAQLLQPPRDLHRGAVVCSDPERAHPRVRRRRRSLA